MKMINGQSFILLIIYSYQSTYAINAEYNTGKEIWKLYSIIDKITSSTSHDGNRRFCDNIAMNQELRNQMVRIHKQLDEMDKFMGRKIIHYSFESWTSSIIIYKYIDTLELTVSSVDEYYRTFFQIINGTSYRSDTLQEHMQSLIPDIGERILLIRRNAINANSWLIQPWTQQNGFSHSQFCDGPQIISHALVQLFRMVIVAEMKAHVMFAIARILPLPQSVGSMNILTREQLEKQFGIYVNLFALNIRLTETVYLRACDPIGAKWIRNQSFYELEGTFQTAIFGYNSFTCKGTNCNEVWFENAQACDAKYYNDRSGCSGALSQCAWLNANQACILESGPYKFRYINSTGLGLLGRASHCTEDMGYIIEEGMSQDLSHTSCICNCDRDHNKISLLVMKSNMDSNHVITGLRFVRKNQILHIQPREGKLGADGYIYPYSQRWIRIPENIPESQIHPVDREHRVFFLDDVQLPTGFVLIGVKFHNVQRGTVIGFAIKIFGVPLNYGSGKLTSDRQFMESKQASNDKPGRPVSFEERSSAFSTRPHTVTPTDMKYVALKRSNLRDDVGQSTLPLFDAVPVHSNPPSALGGIGMFHKGDQGFAGFISLRVYGIRYAKYFTDFESNCMKNDKVLFNHSQCCL